MKFLMVFFAIFGLGVLYVMNEDSSGAVSGGPRFATSYDAAMSQARTTGKPVILIFSAHWCGPCRMMKEEVYPSAAVSPFWNKFVWAYLDVDQSANQLAAQKFGVRGIPAIFVVGPDGKQRASQAGSRPPAEFAAWLSGHAGR